MKRFEYSITYDLSEDDLNLLGDAGWELVSCSQVSYEYVKSETTWSKTVTGYSDKFVLKREIASKQQEPTQ